MAVQKFSQITQSVVNLTAADFMMVVQNGTTDLLYTPTQITAGLNTFTNALKGLVPASGGGTTNFMRADGSWAAPPGTISPGGAVNTIQFNSAGSFGGMSGTSWDDTNRSLTITGSTVTANNPIFNITQTWNNGAVAFSALKVNVTLTANAAGSRFIDFLGSSASFCYIDKSGIFVATGASSAGAGVQVLTGNDGSALALCVGWPAGVGNAIKFDNTGEIRWTASTAGAGQDVVLTRDAPGILAQRFGVNAQVFRVYNTTDGAGNDEWGGFDWQTTSNTFRIRSTKDGTGTARIVSVDGFNKAGAPANTDIPSGTYGFLRDTSGNHTYLIYNNAGTIQKVELL